MCNSGMTAHPDTTELWKSARLLAQNLVFRFPQRRHPLIGGDMGLLSKAMRPRLA